MDENKKSKKKPIKIAEWKPSLLSFIFSAFLLFIALLYILIEQKGVTLKGLSFLFILNVAAFCFSFYNYDNKIILTNRQIVIKKEFLKQKKSIHLLNDFKEISYEGTRSFLGKFINLGTIAILTQDNELFRISFLKEPQQIYDQICEEYKKYFLEKNPNHVFNTEEEVKDA